MEADVSAYNKKKKGDKLGANDLFPVELGGNGKSQNRVRRQRKVCRVGKDLRTNQSGWDSQILREDLGKNVKVLPKLLPATEALGGSCLGRPSRKEMVFHGLLPPHPHRRTGTGVSKWR